jgi:hypothetical protein
MIFDFAYGQWGWPLWLSIVITAAIGIVFGLVNGLLVAYVGLYSRIFASRPPVRPAEDRQNATRPSISICDDHTSSGLQLPLDTALSTVGACGLSGLTRGASVGSDTLHYSVQPDSIDYSGGPDALSVVTLTVTGENASGTDVSISAISVSVGDIGSGQTSLTENPDSVAVAPGPVTPWAMGGGAAGTWTAVPLPPATVVGAQASISFILADVVVNELPGVANLVITEITDHTRTIELPITKTNKAPPGSTPTITTFAAAPTEVARNGTTTLEWNVTDATSCVLRPHGITVQPSGSLPVQVPGTTTFFLDAYGTGGSATTKVTVVVGSAKIITFTASPPGPVRAGAEVVLSWETEDASACSIDQGVGPVPPSSHVTVTPTQTTVYTLAAAGLDPQSSAVTVTVTP